MWAQSMYLLRLWRMSSSCLWRPWQWALSVASSPSCSWCHEESKAWTSEGTFARSPLSNLSFSWARRCSPSLEARKFWSKHKLFSIVKQTLLNFNPSCYFIFMLLTKAANTWWLCIGLLSNVQLVYCTVRLKSISKNVIATMETIIIGLWPHCYLLSISAWTFQHPASSQGSQNTHSQRAAHPATIPQRTGTLLQRANGTNRRNKNHLKMYIISQLVSK